MPYGNKYNLRFSVAFEFMYACHDDSRLNEFDTVYDSSLPRDSGCNAINIVPGDAQSLKFLNVSFFPGGIVLEASFVLKFLTIKTCDRKW